MAIKKEKAKKKRIKKSAEVKMFVLAVATIIISFSAATILPTLDQLARHYFLAGEPWSGIGTVLLIIVSVVGPTILIVWSFCRGVRMLLNPRRYY